MIDFKYLSIYLIFSQISAYAYRVTRLPSPRYTVSEVPHWDVKSQSLYYVDIADFNSTLNRYDYVKNRVYQAKIDNAPSLLFILPIKCKKHHFLVGIENKAVIAIWNGRSSKATVLGTLFELDAGTSNIINDVKTDQYGRFYGGTKSVEECDSNEPAKGGFYTYRKGRGLEKFFGHLSISNGLTWVRKTNKFYYIDSCAYDVKEFDYDPRTGEIMNGRSIFSIIRNSKKPNFILDGMTSDIHGNLYMATFGGDRIIKFNPQTRKVLKEIELPATQISSMAFGGPKMNILFVTTANKDGEQPEGSGYLYKVTGLCAEGYPGVKFNLC